MKFEFFGVEFICLNVKGNNNIWFFFCVCYWFFNKCKVIDFIFFCFIVVENMLKIRSEFVFIGDFNIDMMNYVDGNLYDFNNYFFGFCDCFCFINIIMEVIRVIIISKILIDVILVNWFECWSKSGMLKLGISDYDFVYIIRK